MATSTSHLDATRRRVTETRRDARSGSSGDFGSPEDARALDFVEHRPLLFSIAYRMLGSVTEAEDVLQEAYLRYRRAAGDVQSPKSLLCRIVTNLCLDALKSARARREEYVGPWLPEPLMTSDVDEWAAPSDRVDRYDSISMAFLILLESLSPLERAIFLLREVFDFEYPEIAEIVGKNEAAVRQSFHRAKQHLVDRRPRFPTSREEQQRLAQTFLQAAEDGDLDGLMALLSENITVWSDGGGQAPAARNIVHGREKAARFAAGLARRRGPDAVVELTEANGHPAILLRVRGTPILVAVFESDGRQIESIRIVVNPAKLRHIPTGP